MVAVSFTALHRNIGSCFAYVGVIKGSKPMSERELKVGDYKFRGTASSYDGYVIWDVLLDDSWEPIDDGMLEHVLDRLAKAEGVLDEVDKLLSFDDKPDHSCEALDIVVAAKLPILRYQGKIPDEVNR